MLPLLTKYLVRYKRVSIPHVGTFEIVQQAPQLNVADKIILPPSFTTRYHEKDAVPDHQLDFFISSQTERENIRQELLSFGERLKSHIRQSAFYWNGLGTLRYRSSSIVFEPEDITVNSLSAVPAERVLRENVQHHVLVGDREMTSEQVSSVLSKTAYKRPWFIVAGWTLLILAFIAILIILYLKHFQTTSTGLQLRF